MLSLIPLVLDPLLGLQPFPVCFTHQTPNLAALFNFAPTVAPWKNYTFPAFNMIAEPFVYEAKRCCRWQDSDSICFFLFFPSCSPLLVAYVVSMDLDPAHKYPKQLGPTFPILSCCVLA